MLLFAIALFAAPALRAEYVVLRSGQRLTVTSYQLADDKYRLQMAGGSVEVPADEVVSIEPEEVFKPAPVQSVVQPPYRELVEAAAARYSVDANLIASVIAVESNFDPKARSRKNARGLMQLLPETAARLGVRNVEDPQENIDAGTRYLRDLLQKPSAPLFELVDQNQLAEAYARDPRLTGFIAIQPSSTAPVAFVLDINRWLERSGLTIQLHA